MKLIIASIVVFSLVILFLFALFPADISVSRVVQINGNASRVNAKIADLRRWKTWNELVTAGSSNDSSSLTAVKFDAAHIRLNGMNIALLKSSTDSILTRWEYGQKSFTGSFILTEMNGRIILEWTLRFHLGWYPWNKLAGMFYDKQLGPLMEGSLLKLQKELETE